MIDQTFTPNTQGNKEIVYKKNSPAGIFWIVLAVAVSFYFGVAWGKKNSNDQALKPSSPVAGFIKSLSDPKDLFKNTESSDSEKIDFNIFWEAWKQVDSRYVDEGKLDAKKRVYGAIKGMVGALGDPYSSFMDPDESKAFNSEMEGSFDGIGAELAMKDGVLTIVAPIDGSPAQRAGIKAGDKIFKINDDMTSDITVDEAVKRIRGPKGTTVKLTIVREGENKPQELTITRDKIEIKSVIYEKKDSGVAYIRITKFAEDTTKEFNRAIATAISDSSKGIIVDVRNNPGGFLNSAVEIASKFIPKGGIVVWEQGRDGNKKSFSAIGGDSVSNIPVVVLMNEGSASASEILAGALRDDRNAKLIGTKSFGKGSVQQLEELSDGSTLRVTIAKWLTPSGQSIHEVGLNPDIQVDISDDDAKNNKDTQLEKALEEIKNEINK